MRTGTCHSLLFLAVTGAGAGLVVDIDIVDTAIVVDTHLTQRIGHDQRVLAALQFAAIFSFFFVTLAALNQILRGFVVLFCFFFTVHERLIRDRVRIVTCHIGGVAIIGGAIISAAVVRCVRRRGARRVVRGLWMHFDFNLSRVSTSRIIYILQYVQTRSRS